MSLDELLKEMGACGSARRLWVEWCDDSIPKAAETLVRTMIRAIKDASPGEASALGMGSWWLRQHIRNVELPTQLMVLDEVERAVRRLRWKATADRPPGAEWTPVDSWLVNLRLEVRKTEDTRFVHWTAVMGRRRVS